MVSIRHMPQLLRPCGAMVARLTPDQKVACSSHVGVIVFNLSRVFSCTAINIKLLRKLMWVDSEKK